MSAIALNRMIGGVLLAMVFALAPTRIASADPPYRIMMVLWRGCEEACRGFQDYFNDQEIRADFIVRDANQDSRVFPRLVAEARGLKVDLVVTWGTPVTLGMVSEYDKVDSDMHLDDIPVLFMLVSDPLASRIVPSLGGSGRNVSGTLYLASEVVQMRVARSYLPFEKVGMIYNTDELNAVQAVDNMRAAAAEQGFTLVTRTVPLDAGGRPMPETLPRLIGELADEGVDLIYLASISFLVMNQDAFTNAAVERGIPVAAAGEAPVVQSNALIGLVSSHYAVGQLTASRARQILVEGADPAIMPIEGLRHFSLTVNMHIARKLELYPPMLLLDIIDVIKRDGPQS